MLSYYTPRTFPIKEIQRLQTLPPPRGSRRRYADIVCAFDIETTRIPGTDESIMYVWQLQLGEDYTIIGRTWQEFQSLMRAIASNLFGKYLVVYVHNLSFEFQFLRGIYDFQDSDVFCIKSRKVLRAEMLNAIEFRCSYIHSNMSLAEYTAKMKVKHQKLSGEEYDYSKVRYPWTPLDEKELAYDIHDVKGLVEAITAEMKHDGDDLYSIPLTSTGYVRRDIKAAMLRYGREHIAAIMPTYEVYQLLREAFRGGNTHANRYYVDKIVENVHSCDRSSSYPDVQCNCLFPVSPFFKDDDHDIEHVLDLIERREKACLMRIALTGNIHLSDKYWGCPYLSRDKSRNVKDGVYDNGRILSASYLETTITDVDLRIIMDEYDFDDINILDLYWSTYGRLPEPMVAQISKYYEYKTELKDVSGQEVFYTKSKNKLNSIYGMSAQDPVKAMILYSDFDYMEDDSKLPDRILEESNKHAVTPYQWGVWTTAWARLRLEEGIKLAGDNFVYCDTDSVKYVGNVEWTELNAKLRNQSMINGAYAVDRSGDFHFMGVWEREMDYAEFKTLGAKKYAYTYSRGGATQITVAGVSKKKGAKELTAAGGLKAFEEGFIFREGGGNELVYNDHREAIEKEIDGHKIQITSNVTIKPSTYELGVTAEYRNLLQNL